MHRLLLFAFVALSSISALPAQSPDEAPAGGGNADGHYMLVVEITPAGWKIVRDDTTADPAK